MSRLAIVRAVLRRLADESGYGAYVSDETIDKWAREIVASIEECER